MSSLAKLNDRNFNGHRVRPIPHPLDDVLSAAIAEYRRGDPRQRQAIRDDLSRMAIRALYQCPERLAAVAVRTRSTEPLRQALIALGIVAARLDEPYDHLYPLAAINDSAVRLGTSLDILIGEVADEVPPDAITLFHEFARRTDRDKSLEAFNRHIRGENESFQYC